MEPIERLEKSNTVENLWIYILLILREQPSYSWEIFKIIQKKFGFKLGLITPYRVLYKLESRGFVRGKFKEKRKIYQITDKGLKELEKAKNFYKKILLWMEKN
jgi:DNA-binding PadR family transcriptional regulator